MRNRRLCSWKGSQTPKAPPAEAYQQVSDDDDRHEEGQTRGRTRDLHAVPEKLSPWSRQYSEDAEEGVEEIDHVPSRQTAVLWNFTQWSAVSLVKLVTDCDESKEDGEQKKRIFQRDLEKHMEPMPPSSQPEEPQLHKTEKWATQVSRQLRTERDRWREDSQPGNGTGVEIQTSTPREATLANPISTTLTATTMDSKMFQLTWIHDSRGPGE